MIERPELKIRISQLSEGIHSYHFTTLPTALSLDKNFQGNVEIDAELEKTRRQLYLTVHVTAKVAFQCDRCTDNFIRQLNGSYTVCYVYDENPAETTPDDDLRLMHIGTPTLDLTDDVRQVVILAVPMKIVCQEDCLGLCSHCGINLNEGTCSCNEEKTDTRWDALRNLITQNNN